LIKEKNLENFKPAIEELKNQRKEKGLETSGLDV
jgi:hypothetical protein